MPASDNTFYIKQDDREPAIRETLLTDDGNPILLSGATVKFSMIEPDSGTVKVNAATADVVDPNTGVVEYAWTTGDTDTAGRYLREWEVTFASGRKETVPNDRRGYPTIVMSDIA